MEELTPTKLGKDMRKWFMFPEGYRNLNHGSFGACPTPVIAARRAYQDASESHPDAFQRYQQPQLLLDARKAFAAALRTPYTNLVLAPNATSGVNAVLRNLVFQPGDYIIHFSTIYGACGKCVQSLRETTPVEGLSIPLSYGSPATSPTPADIVKLFTDAIVGLRAQGANPRIAIFDTVTSQPGAVMPYTALTRVCAEQNVLSMIDGAHGVGCIPLDLGELRCDFLVSNAHKWAFTPRHCAILFVAPHLQKLLRTSYPTSHGWEPMPASKHGSKAVDGPVKKSPLAPAAGEESLFARTFAFTGTLDISSYLAGTAALHFRDVVCCGEEKILNYCARLAKEGGAEVASLLGTEVMDDRDGYLTKDNPMVNIRLPLRPPASLATQDSGKLDDAHPVVDVDERGPYCVNQWMEARTSDEYATFIMVYWHDKAWWTRLSAQVYLDMDDFRFAASCLRELCERVEKREHLSKSVERE